MSRRLSRNCICF